ncbi:hypothetical protein WR25_14101 [Diploscapter pachys]|uniref:N-acetyltransferase domain-containing protein n=1 Tax=Diploscapter pachys TaxID=2018661 RepID=A0A2A2JFZ7_9BILA|nr:hypothetical protein WR25_14101 [Diploscapter pachys]
MTSMLYVLPDYRRFGVSSMMLSLQYEKLRELVKKGENVDGMISIPTSNASKQQFLKLGYTEIYTAPPSIYKLTNGQQWQSVDPEHPTVSLMFLKL